MNTKISKIDELVAAISDLKGIEGARLWDRVPGKERIYLDTVKQNGGRRWNGGLGYTECYVDLNSGEVVANGEAGAATRKWHAEIGTFESATRIVRSYTAAETE